MHVMSGAYEVLGLRQGIASVLDVRRAYHSLALLHHPDRPSGSASRFQQVADAFRSITDRDFRLRVCPRAVSATHVREQAREVEVVVPRVMRLTVDEFLHGGVRDVPITSAEKCPECRGTGARDPRDFIVCLGCRGLPLRSGTCVSCGGEGGCNVSMRGCLWCKGARTCAMEKVFHVSVPAGAAEGSTIATDGLTWRVSLQELPLIIPVQHGRLSIQDDSTMLLTVDVTLGEMLCGFQRKLKMFDMNITVSHSIYDPVLCDPKREFCKVRSASPRPIVVICFLSIVFPEKGHIAPFRAILDRMLN